MGLLKQWNDENDIALRALSDAAMELGAETRRGLPRRYNKTSVRLRPHLRRFRAPNLNRRKPPTKVQSARRLRTFHPTSIRRAVDGLEKRIKPEARAVAAASLERQKERLHRTWDETNQKARSHQRKGGPGGRRHLKALTPL